MPSANPPKNKVKFLLKNSPKHWVAIKLYVSHMLGNLGNLKAFYMGIYVVVDKGLEKIEQQKCDFTLIKSK